jgi:hypothetical protein
MWKNIELDRPQIAMSIECRIPKTTNTHSEFVILIAFPLLECLRERASVLRYSTLPVFSELTYGAECNVS